MLIVSRRALLVPMRRRIRFAARLMTPTFIAFLCGARVRSRRLRLLTGRARRLN